MKRPRWGVRTLWFLGLATVSVLTSNVLYARGDDRFVLLTTAGIVIGLVGAAVCSVRGLRALMRS